MALLLTFAGSHLQHITFSGDRFIDHRVYEEPDEQPRDQAGHDHDGEGLLGV
jgi:hypothetical protein